jgi:hypothetical protein
MSESALVPLIAWSSPRSNAPRMARAVWLRLVECQRFTAIAADLGVSAPRASQVFDAGMRALRRTAARGNPAGRVQLIATCPPEISDYALGTGRWSQEEPRCRDT